MVLYQTVFITVLVELLGSLKYATRLTHFYGDANVTDIGYLNTRIFLFLGLTGFMELANLNFLQPDNVTIHNSDILKTVQRCLDLD